MKNHEKQIRDIINGDGSIIEDVNKYIQQETIKIDLFWCKGLLIFICFALTFYICKDPCKHETKQANKINDSTNNQITKAVL